MDKTFKQRLEILPIKNIEHPVGNTKYYAAVHVKSLIAQADEEYQELFDKYSNLNDSYEKEVIRSSKLESQIIDLKSQLQQQALPVVPECVAKTVEILKKNPESSWSKLYEALGEEGVTWLNEFQHKDERFGFGGLNSKLIVLFHLAINGYQVEKPQLFFLKNTLTHEYLYRKYKTSLEEQSYCKGTDGKPLDYCLFTLDEIESMNTGSYEQIEVAE
ncbi:DUF1642 domain-containing protein [Lactococcus lactis]|uniref:DUF1642 domain-containing protein n=1 Tax=Lactococcus lactis TaxID=1358 RepID=UPI00072B4FA6|nr:DUF1642 domain-containing protein [Lactococcus lactis]KST93939.1 hypothetical protein KF146_2269 [Lactococcus lactis subsp. lactis]MDU0397830.1 hypothetical protein [Lactococcus lactis]